MHYQALELFFHHPHIVTYDDDLSHLAIIEDLEVENLISFPVPDYRPYERIIDTPTRRVKFRWLVGAATNPP